MSDAAFGRLALGIPDNLQAQRTKGLPGELAS